MAERSYPAGDNGAASEPPVLEYAQPPRRKRAAVRKRREGVVFELPPLPLMSTKLRSELLPQPPPPRPPRPPRPRRIVVRNGVICSDDAVVRVEQVKSISVRRQWWRVAAPVQLVAEPRAAAEEPYVLLDGTDDEDFEWLARALSRVAHLPEERGSPGGAAPPPPTQQHNDH